MKVCIVKRLCSELIIIVQRNKTRIYNLEPDKGSLFQDETLVALNTSVLSFAEQLVMLAGEGLGSHIH